MTLPSNASTNVYPSNTVANYTVALPNRIELQDGSWEVGMTDFAYPVNWYNVPRGEWFRIVANSDDKDVGVGPFLLSEGRYESGRQLVDAMRDAWDDYWMGMKYKITQIQVDYKGDGQTKIPVSAGTVLTPLEQMYKQRIDVSTVPDVTHASVSFLYNDQTNVAKFKLTSTAHELQLSSKLGDILAIPNHVWNLRLAKLNTEIAKIYESLTEVDINRGCHTIFVYCNVVQDSIVGDVRAPLLRAVTVRGVNGSTTSETFTRPIYVPLKTQSFDSIEIAIKSEDGSLVPFAYGNSFVTLHFRRITY